MDVAGHVYRGINRSGSHRILLPPVQRILTQELAGKADRRVFDLGCGNGTIANDLVGEGYQVSGADASETGIAAAREHFPHIDLRQMAIEDDIAGAFGTFPVVISLEVVEHIYSPRQFAKTLYDLLQPGGLAIVSTPYHGYLKNLALAVAGKMDKHYTVLQDHGHIKFWSMTTLTTLLREAGFESVSYERVGRIPPLAMSMIAVARRGLA